MKSSELHQWIRSSGWRLVRISGSHIIYEKYNRRVPVPYHGSKEIGVGLLAKIKKQMNLKY
ncbi:MAG: hypothetical protein RI965_688 [Bacteroidota bacterium]|jgi:mRNA interferase HicA